jgi:hypothetical protein
MTQFTDPWGKKVYIDLRAVIAMSEPKQVEIPNVTKTLLWTSAPSENCYFGVREPMEECLQRWRSAHGPESQESPVQQPIRDLTPAEKFVVAYLETRGYKVIIDEICGRLVLKADGQDRIGVLVYSGAPITPQQNDILFKMQLEGRPVYTAIASDPLGNLTWRRIS